MKPSAIMTGALVVFVLLVIMSVELKRPAIEADLVRRTESALQGEGLGFIDVAAEGRDLSLKGRLSSASQEAKAIAIAEDVWGARVVKNHLQIKLPRLGDDMVRAQASALLEEPTSAHACDEAIAALKATSGKIRFQKNSIQLTPSAKTALASLAKALGRCPRQGFTVEGHTDSWGKSKHNMRLSLTRARGVVSELERLGVGAGRGAATGFGETKPIASNKSAAGRNKNRRIEFKLLGS